MISRSNSLSAKIFYFYFVILNEENFSLHPSLTQCVNFHFESGLHSLGHYWKRFHELRIITHQLLLRMDPYTHKWIAIPKKLE